MKWRPGLTVETHQVAERAKDRESLASFGRNQPALADRGAKGRGLRRAALAVVAFGSSVMFLAAIAGGLLILRLSTGPIDVNIAPQISAALNDRVGGRYTFTLGSTAIEESDHGPQLTINRFDLANASGRTILTAPSASVSVDPFDLVFGRISPKRIEVQNVTLRVLRLEDGSIGIAAGTEAAGEVKIGDLASTLSAPEASGGTAPAPSAASGTAAPAGRAAAAVDLPGRLADVVSRLVDQVFDAQGPLHAVDRIGLSHGSLLVDDRMRHATTTYHNLAIDIDRETSGGIFATVGADGPSGRWSLASRATIRPDGVKSVDIAADHLSTDELMLAAGQRKTFFESDMPLSFSFNILVGADGKLRRASGPLSFGAGYFKLDDPDHEPALVDHIDTTVTMAPDTGALDFGAGTLVAGPTSYKFDLAIAPPAAANPWIIDGKATGIFGPERPSEAPIALEKIDFRVFAKPAERQVVVEHFAVEGPEVNFHMGATLQITDPGFNITSEMQAGRMPAQAVLRLWPSWIAAPPRAWLLANVKGGTLDSGSGHVFLTDTDLETMRHQHSVPDDHVHIDFAFSNAALTFMPGVPPLRGLDASGVITGDQFVLNAPRAEMEISPGHKLSASEGTFVIASTDPKPTPTEIKLRIAGGIDAVADLLSRDALKPYADLPIDSSSVSGQLDGHLTIDLKLGDHVPQEDTRIRVEATAKDFTAAKVLGKESLTDATLAITADRSSLHAKGDGRIFGAPATIDLKKVAGGAPSDAQVGLTLDDAARQRAGFSFGKALIGPVGVKISTTLAPGERSRALVEVDLTRAALDTALPGLKKAAARPSKLTFGATQENGRTTLEGIVFDNGSAAIRGSANLDGSGALASASLSQVRLSPGDDAKADLTRTADGLRLVVRGTNIDARPFLKTALASDAGSGGDTLVRDLDLDLHSNLLTGDNAQALSNVDLKMLRKGGQLRRIQMSGRLGRGPFTVVTGGAGPGTTVTVASKDAGATLEFLDLYKRMDGGRLDSTLRVADGRIDGVVEIHQFTIKEDPTIKKLADEQIPSSSRNAGARIDPAAVSFTKLEASFSKVGNKVDVRQGSMFGPNVGATVEGTIDFAHDKVALSGTFVPIYGLNNLFSQIPVVGVLLGGGSHEGLFALNYKINGSASAPVLTFNPLSALAPGFLRKIFGAIDDAAQQGLDPGASHDQGAAPATAPVPAQPE